MPLPDFGPIGKALYYELAPLAFDDPNQDYALAKFLHAIGLMTDEIETWVRDTPEGYPGWSLVLDIDRVPDVALDWLAQFVGVQLDHNLPGFDQRQQIRSQKNFKRGTVRSLIEAAQPFLTGTKSVMVRERVTDAYNLTVVTFASETQITVADYASLRGQYVDYQELYDEFLHYQEIYDLALGTSREIEAALRAMKPAGLVMDYHVLNGQDYYILWQENPQYFDIIRRFSDYQAIMDYETMPIPFEFELLYESTADYQVLYDDYENYGDIYDWFFTY